MNDTLKFINDRIAAYNMILNYFVSGGITDVVAGSGFNTIIVVCKWDRPDMTGREICNMVDDLIAHCPAQSFFTLTRQCNCIDIIDNVSDED